MIKIVNKFPLTIKNGKFYRGGEFVPIEFGNKEQFDLMQSNIRVIEGLKNDKGLEVDVEFETQIIAKFDFKCCNCFKNVFFEKDDCDSEDDDDLVHESIVCRSCKSEYETFLNDDDNLSVKLKIK